MSFAMSMFVFLFLLIFQPFDLGSMFENIVWVTGGYGMCCLGVMLFLNLFIVEILPGIFKEESWTVLKELIWVTINVSLIGVANAFYSAWIFNVPVSFKLVLLFELYTLAVAIIPLVISTLINFYRLKGKFEQTSGDLNKSLEHRMRSKKQEKDLITIHENETAVLQIHPGDLIYIQSADNYVDIHHRESKEIIKTVMRKTLKGVKDELGQFENIKQVHRSYIVNLDHVNYVSGNAQGLKLHIDGIIDLIPVSRNLTEEIKSIFETGQ